MQLQNIFKSIENIFWNSIFSCFFILNINIYIILNEVAFECDLDDIICYVLLGVILMKDRNDELINYLINLMIF